MSAQNWSQKASSVASTGCGGTRGPELHRPLPMGPRFAQPVAKEAPERDATAPLLHPCWCPGATLVGDILQPPRAPAGTDRLGTCGAQMMRGQPGIDWVQQPKPNPCPEVSRRPPLARPFHPGTSPGHIARTSTQGLDQAVPLPLERRQEACTHFPSPKLPSLGPRPHPPPPHPTDVKSARVNPGLSDCTCSPGANQPCSSGRSRLGCTSAFPSSVQSPHCPQPAFEAQTFRAPLCLQD